MVTLVGPMRAGSNTQMSAWDSLGDDAPISQPEQPGRSTAQEMDGFLEGEQLLVP